MQLLCEVYETFSIFSVKYFLKRILTLIYNKKLYGALSFIFEETKFWTWGGSGKSSVLRLIFCNLVKNLPILVKLYVPF